MEETNHELVTGPPLKPVIILFLCQVAIKCRFIVKLFSSTFFIASLYPQSVTITSLINVLCGKRIKSIYFYTSGSLVEGGMASCLHGAL